MTSPLSIYLQFNRKTLIYFNNSFIVNFVYKGISAKSTIVNIISDVFYHTLFPFAYIFEFC